MKPTIGRTVIVLNYPANGALEQPAIITRAWNYDADAGRGLVNVTILPDCGQPTPFGSMPIFESRKQAEAFLATQGPTSSACFWPDRV